jgi:hypothetical protein
VQAQFRSRASFCETRWFEVRHREQRYIASRMRSRIKPVSAREKIETRSPAHGRFLLRREARSLRSRRVRARERSKRASLRASTLVVQRLVVQRALRAARSRAALAVDGRFAGCAGIASPRRLCAEVSKIVEILTVLNLTRNWGEKALPSCETNRGTSPSNRTGCVKRSTSSNARTSTRNGACRNKRG